MADNELLIKINADAKNAVKAFDDVKAKTEDLDEVLAKSSAIAAVAFAALTAEVGFAIHAFGEAEAASKTLSQALQNQGIYTKDLADEYKGYAKEVENATGIDDDALVKAQAIAQGYLGQTKITKELTLAIADLAEKQGGDLNEAATLIGKTIGTNTNILARQGLQLSETATEAEKMAKVLEFVNQKAGGFAAAANEGVGSIRGLKTAFGDLQEEIGARFAPVLEIAVAALTKTFQFISSHPEIVDLTVALIAAGGAIAAIATFVPAAVIAFNTLAAAFAAVGIAGAAATAAIFAIPLAIGVLVFAIVELALHWKEVWGTIEAVTKAAVTNISELLGGLGHIIKGVFTFDSAEITKGLDEIKGAFTKAKNDYVQIKNEQVAANKEGEETQNADRKAAADKAAAIEREKQANLRNIRQQEIALGKLQNEHASQELIDLKTQEIATLKALNEQKSAEERALLLERQAQIIALEQDAQSEELGRATAFQEELSATKLELLQEDSDAVFQLRATESAAIQASLLTDADVERKLLADKLKANVAARNQELIDRKKHGEVIASLNKFLATEEVEGVKTATGELVALQNSRNSTLKAIGKAAAIAQITIKTAESAISIFNGFATIPFIGYALGIAGAAAAIAYGGEQIATVTGAASGGLIEGGIPGKDSVPALLTPGELVVPRKNFNDVVGSVQGGGNNSGFNDQAISILQSIDSKVGNGGGTTVIQGDVLADETYIDALVRKISDSVELRNGKIFGLNT